MFSAFSKFSSFFSLFTQVKERKFATTVSNIIGQTPRNLDLYKLAFCHTSMAKEVGPGIRNSYERLEYLGDAILGAVVAEFLFKKFPYKNEGFLTEIRSRIVNREALNQVGKKIGLTKIVEYSGRGGSSTHKSLYGDALEALVGAIYLDKGFKERRKFILKRLIYPHFDIDGIIQNNLNFKSILIEWAQKENKNIKFLIIKELGTTHNKEFTAEVLLDDQAVSSGTGSSKKKAEQSAAEKACELLNLK